MDSPLEIPIEISDKQIDKGLEFVAKSLTRSDELAGDITKQFVRQQEELNRIRALSNPRAIEEQVRLEKEITKAKEDQARLIAKAGGGPGGALKQLTNPQNLGALGGAIVGGQGGAGVTGQVGGMIGEVIAGPIGAAIGGQLGPALAAAAPGAMAQLSMVFEDVSAVIGRTFIPVLETVTPLLRMGADILATILPSAGEMREAIQPLTAIIGEMGGNVRELWNALGPILHGGIILGLQIFAKTLEYVSIPMRFLAAIVSEVANAFTDGAKNIRGSTGAAARQASFQGFGQYQQSFQTAAFSMGGAGGASVSSMPGDIRSMREFLQGDLKQALKDFGTILRSIAHPVDALKDGVKEAAKDPVGTVKKRAKTAANVATLGLFGWATKTLDSAAKSVGTSIGIPEENF